MQRILEVTAVHLAVLKSHPPKIHLVATGQVPTSGWRNAALNPWFYIAPPKDGVQDFDFTADEPVGIVSQVVVPVTAEVLIDRDPATYWGPDAPLLGVRIHARMNAGDATFADGGGAGDAKVLSDRWVPWPLALADLGDGLPDLFPSRPAASPADAVSTLIGKELRVYHPGDPLTLDWRSNRVNIQVTPDTRRILSVSFG